LNATILIQTALSGAAAGGLYALVAVGFGLVYRTTRVFNFAQGALGALAAYLSFGFVSVWHVHFVLAGIVACVVVGAVAVVAERVALRPLYARGELYTYVSTIGLGFAIQSAILTVWGPIPKSVPSMFGDVPVVIGSLRIVPQVVCVLVISLALALATHLFLTRTRVGTAMRAAAQDRTVASLLAINPNHMYGLAFFLSGVLAAVAGILIAPIGVLQPTLGLSLGLPGFIAALIGGLGSMSGAVVGGLLLGIAQSLAVFVVPPKYAQLALYAILTVVILVRPSGIFGEETIEARQA
jgi:branched-chain amino acid transport system permease protein